MLVQRILEFINSLGPKKVLSECDISLKKELSTRFSQRDPRGTLNAADIQFLLGIYTNRWENVFDNENDYTRNPSAINQAWIVLSKELYLAVKEQSALLMHNSIRRDLYTYYSKIVKLGYLKILIPTITNTNDFNDLSPLTETNQLVNFYLGHGGTYLFRKRSLCEHMIAGNKYELSTYRSLSPLKKLSPITVDELARLKLCKQINGQFSIDNEKFEHFWAFLRGKIFTNLSKSRHGKMPIGLLPHLIELIERYYLLKEQSSSFEKFKDSLKSFFKRMYGYEYTDVNYLYGVKIQYKGESHFLLDLFIELHEAKGFELDHEMQVLSSWLYQYHPALIANCKDLVSIYPKQTGESDRSAHHEQSDAIARCCSILVSLLTKRFNFSFFLFSRSISFWDMNNTVFPDAARIYILLLPLIRANRIEQLPAAYNHIVTEIVGPSNRDKSWTAWLTRHESSYEWLELILANNLPEIFDPAQVLSALLSFHSRKPNVVSQINIFLDRLINTYAQDDTENELMKKLRVNILFVEFLGQLSEHHRKHLIMLVKISDPHNASPLFIDNCISHINNRLYQLSPISSDGPPQFFNPKRHMDHAKFFVVPKEIKHVSKVIAYYKAEHPRLSVDMEKYLHNLGLPILSLKDRENARNSARVLDYLGSPT